MINIKSGALRGQTIFIQKKAGAEFQQHLPSMDCKLRLVAKFYNSSNSYNLRCFVGIPSLNYKSMRISITSCSVFSRTEKSDKITPNPTNLPDSRKNPYIILPWEWRTAEAQKQLLSYLKNGPNGVRTTKPPVLVSKVKSMAAPKKEIETEQTIIKKLEKPHVSESPLIPKDKYENEPFTGELGSDIYTKVSTSECDTYRVAYLDPSFKLNQSGNEACEILENLAYARVTPDKRVKLEIIYKNNLFHVPVYFDMAGAIRDFIYAKKIKEPDNQKLVAAGKYSGLAFIEKPKSILNEKRTLSQRDWAPKFY